MKKLEERPEMLNEEPGPAPEGVDIPVENMEDFDSLEEKLENKVLENTWSV